MNQNAAFEAAQWFIRLQDATLSREQQEDFADWLRRSPLHIEEFLRLTALRGDLARVPELATFDIDQAVARLQHCAAGNNIVSLNAIEVAEPGQSIPARARRRAPVWLAPRWEGGVRALRFVAAAAIAVVAIGMAVRPLRDFLVREHYSTQVGEQRSLTLADGTQVQLNAVSNLRTQIDKTVRELHLDEGEALFEVAKDPVHPFRVHTPQATIEAKGTQFNVHVSKGKTVVSLLEGRVLVTPPSGSRPILLNAGEQIVISDRPSVTPEPHLGDLEVAVAWTQRRLVLQDAPLSEVIAEFNRYSRQPFAINDPELAAARITISFAFNSPQTFAESLSAVGGLHVVEQRNGTLLIERE